MQTSDVQDLLVSDSPVQQAARRRLTTSVSSYLRVPNGVATMDTSVSLTYTIVILRSLGISYDTLSKELIDGVRSNRFTKNLRSSAATYNVPELQSASSSTVTTTNTTPGDTGSNKKHALSLIAILGIAIGGCAAIVCLVFVLHRFHYFDAPRKGNILFLSPPSLSCESDIVYKLTVPM